MRLIHWILEFCGFDNPAEVTKLRTRLAELEVKEAERIEREEAQWGEDYLNEGPFKTKRTKTARSGEFSTWTIDAIGSNKHPGIAQAYGKLNAQRIVACLNACAGMKDPMVEINQLKEGMQK
jgi:hypothetical protein